MIHLRLSDGTQVDGTATHRFWSVTRGDWFAARDLRVGESLRTPSGTVRVDEARVEAVLTPVFNLEVEGAHEFFVGHGQASLLERDRLWELANGGRRSRVDIAC